MRKMVDRSGSDVPQRPGLQLALEGGVLVESLARVHLHERLDVDDICVRAIEQAVEQRREGIHLTACPNPRVLPLMLSRLCHQRLLTDPQALVT